MTGLNIGVGGVWKSGTPYVGVSGVWKAVQAGWVGVGGVWKQFYTAFAGLGISMTNGNWFPVFVNGDPGQGVDHFEGVVFCTVSGGSGNFSAVWTPTPDTGDATGAAYSSGGSSPLSVSVTITDNVTGNTIGGSATIS